MFLEKKLMVPVPQLITVQLFLIALLQIVPLYNIENTLIEQVALLITFAILLVILGKNIQFVGSKWNLLLLFAFFSSISITVMLYGGIGSAVMACNLLLASIIFNNIEITKNAYKAIHFSLATLVTLYVMTVDISYIFSTVVVDRFGNKLNSNMFALFSLAAYFHWICYIYTCEIKRWKKGALFVFVSAVATYYIWISDSRTALISFVIFWILCEFKSVAFSKSQFRAITITILILSMLFPIAYVALAKNYSEATFLGKSVFSGRQYVWDSTFDAIAKHPILGSGNNIVLYDAHGRKTVSTHNMLLGFWKMFGLIPTITIVRCLVNNFSNKKLFKRNRIAQFAFLATLSCVFFESFYTNSHLYMLFAFFLLSFVSDEKN